MPNFTTDIYTNQVGAAGASSSASYPDAKNVAGKERHAIVPYTVDGAEVTGDTLQIVKLKKGAIVVPHLCRVLSEAAFDIDNMDVGDGVNVNRYADAIDTTNLASNVVFSGGDENYAPTAIDTGEEVVTATLVNVTTTTAGQLVLWDIAYLDE
jgi:hypothetical protein